jgi:hypothetical protein
MLLKEAENTLAYAKVGFFGFQGSGKTYTSSLIAEGLCTRIGNNKIAFFDTETGSDWLAPKMKANGFKVYQVKSRAFNDLLTVIRECEQNNIGVLIIDSITHVWRELCDSYQRKLNRKRLQFQDWSVIKGEWQKYADAFVNSKVHIIVCGRAGYEYDTEIDEDGNKELIKTGTKMKAEGEFGFEPSLVIEMDRVVPNNEKRTRKGQSQSGVRSKFIHRAYVLKDRSDLLNGEVIDNPTYDSFAQHFEYLNIGGEHIGVDTSRTSEILFDNEGKPQWKKDQEMSQIAIEEIKIEVDKVFPGSTKEEKRAKIRLAEYVFGTASNTAIEKKSRKELETGRDMIRIVLSVKDNINTLLSDEYGPINLPNRVTEDMLDGKQVTVNQ